MGSSSNSKGRTAAVLSASSSSLVGFLEPQLRLVEAQLRMKPQ